MNIKDIDFKEKFTIDMIEEGYIVELDKNQFNPDIQDFELEEVGYYMVLNEFHDIGARRYQAVARLNSGDVFYIGYKEVPRRRFEAEVILKEV